MVLAATRLSVRVQSNLGIIRGGVSQGLSSTAIQGLIRQTGQAGLRRTDLLQGIRHVRGIIDSGTRIRSVGFDRFPDPSRMEISRTTMLSEFSYDVRVRGTSRFTGEQVDRFMTVRSDRNLTPRQILEEAQEAFDLSEAEAKYREAGDDRGFTVIGARRRN